MKRAWVASSDDSLGMIAAGAAFYIIASIAQILAAIVLSYGLFADAQTVQGNIRELSTGQQLDTVVPRSQGKRGLGLGLALLIALYGAARRQYR